MSCLNMSMEAEENSETIHLRKILDVKTQDLHSAKMQLNQVKASVTHLEEENCELRNELEEKKKEMNLMAEVNQMTTNKMASFETKLKLSVEERDQVKEELEICESELRHLAEVKENPSSHSVSQLSASTSFSDGKFFERLSELEEEKAMLQAKLAEAVNELQRYMDSNTELRHENKELQEEVDCIQCQLTSQCDINENLRQELRDLEVGNDTDSVPIAAEIKGNSLFSEVEDRRIIVEKRMVKLQEHVRNLEGNLTKEVKENERLKGRIRQLRQAANQVHNEQTVRSTLQQLVESKMKVAELTEKLQKAEKQGAQRNTEMPCKLQMPENATVADKRFFSYLERQMTQNNQEMEREKSQHEHTKLQLAHCDLLLTQKKNELISLTLERDRLKRCNFDLLSSITDLQRKYEPECHDHKQGSGVKQESLPDSAAQNQNGLERVDKINDGSKTLESKVLAPVPDEWNKENKLSQRGTGVHSPSKSKSVGMKGEVKVISEDGSSSVEELKSSSVRGQRLAKNGRGTGKYKSINVAEMPEADTHANECKQQ